MKRPNTIATTPNGIMTGRKWARYSVNMNSCSHRRPKAREINPIMADATRMSVHYRRIPAPTGQPLLMIGVTSQLHSLTGVVPALSKKPRAVSKAKTFVAPSATLAFRISPVQPR